ncbi:DUF2726 domain-containing protein [Polaromonas sp.]|uniref:DUF2726 domain-containing protein n=1 Tax=Polaromonas sp. TaxID=1869339 RepID=UPI00286A1D3E|nr:DUF2726 domain-containing protein [Polaromonas sp.]
MNQTTWVAMGLAAALGALLGAVLTGWWWRKKIDKPLLLSGKLPLDARGLVTTEEHEVWTWLRHTFHDHVVMVKIPVSRFTLPRNTEKQNSLQWLELLSSIYTTFTVCTTDGRVVGCIDVPGKRGLSMDKRELKEDLLSDCGIAYTVIRDSRLPTSNAMRAAFLGEVLIELVEEHTLATPVEDSAFQEELNAFTRERVKARKEAALSELNKDARNADQDAQDRHADGKGSIKPAKKPGRRVEQTWEDSFIYGPDTRPGELD